MKEHKYRIDENATGVIPEHESIRELAMETVHTSLTTTAFHLHHYLDLDRKTQVEKAAFVQSLRAAQAHLRLLTDTERTEAIERATKHVSPENRFIFQRAMTVEGFLESLAVDVAVLLK